MVCNGFFLLHILHRSLVILLFRGGCVRGEETALGEVCNLSNEHG